MAAIGMPYAELSSSVPGCERLIGAARESDIPIIYTRYVYMADYSDGGLLPTELVPAMREHNALINGPGTPRSSTTSSPGMATSSSTSRAPAPSTGPSSNRC